MQCFTIEGMGIVNYKYKTPHFVKNPSELRKYPKSAGFTCNKETTWTMSLLLIFHNLLFTGMNPKEKDHVPKVFCYCVVQINLTLIEVWVCARSEDIPDTVRNITQQNSHSLLVPYGWTCWGKRPQIPQSSEILNLKPLALPRNPLPAVAQPLYQSITVPAPVSQMAVVPHGQWRATPACYLSRLASTCQLGQPCSYLSTTNHRVTIYHMSHCRPDYNMAQEIGEEWWQSFRERCQWGSCKAELRCHSNLAIDHPTTEALERSQCFFEPLMPPLSLPVTVNNPI